MFDDPDWLETLRAAGKRLEHFMRCADTESGLPHVYLVEQAQTEFHALCTPDRIALLIDAATAKESAEAEAVTWRRALVLAQSLTHSHKTHAEAEIGARIEAALSPAETDDTLARIRLLEQMLVDIHASPDVTLPPSIRERIGDLVDVSIDQSVGIPVGSGRAGED